MICKHATTQKRTTTIKGATIVFKDVPALVCDNCGEKYIDSTVTQELLQKANELVQNGAIVDVRSFQSAA